MNILIAIFLLIGGIAYTVMMNVLLQLAGILTYSTFNVLIGVGLFLIAYIAFIFYRLNKSKTQHTVKQQNSRTESTPIYYQHAKRKV